MKRLKVLAFGAATGRVGHVLMMGGKLLDWGMSRKASKSTGLAALHVQKVIARLSPDVVVTEDVPKSSTKSALTRAIVETIGRAAEKAKVLVIRTRRGQSFPNKYDEATDLSQKFPEIAAWVPRKRRLWESEPPVVTIFEALAFARAVSPKV